MSFSIKNPKAVIAAVVGVVLIAASVALFLSGYGTAGASAKPEGITQTTISAAPVSVTKPTTAAQVAAQLNCGRFHDNGPGAGGLVKDSGICWIGSTKYGINTFANSAGRDVWVKLSEGLGGNAPLRESDVMVFYKASDQGNDNN